MKYLAPLILLFAAFAVRGGDAPAWAEPMKKVHAKFTGTKGTFAHFGDSITVTMAFWSGLQWDRKNASPEMEAAFKLAKEYMLADCWQKWKGPEYGNTGMMTIRWAHENVDNWLKKLKPEVAMIMFGTNDLSQLDVAEYDKKTREVVQKCLDNGTIVILSTIPPRHGLLDKAKVFAETVKKIADDMKVPLLDYFGEIMKRRPDDWDGALEKFKSADKNEYEVPTLVAKDGVHPSNPKDFAGNYSEEALKTNGFSLRNYLTLLSYEQVIKQVLKAEAGK